MNFNTLHTLLNTSIEFASVPRDYYLFTFAWNKIDNVYVKYSPQKNPPLLRENVILCISIANENNNPTEITRCSGEFHFAPFLVSRIPHYVVQKFLRKRLRRAT